MVSIFKTDAATLAEATMLLGMASAESQSASLSGPLRITSDMSNPALTVEPPVANREAWKAQIHNPFTGGAPHVMNWYAAKELDLRQIRSLIDDLIAAHGDMLPQWCRNRRAA